MDESGSFQVEPSLYEFFIYNSIFRGKREEDEYMKILYFYPYTISINRQCNSVGLAEALTNFTSNFNTGDQLQENSCESLLCDNRKHVFLEVEPGYWMVLIANIRSHSYEKHLSDDLEMQEHKKQEALLLKSLKEGTVEKVNLFSSFDVPTFEDFNFSYEILKTVLQDTYSTFTLLNGSFQQILQQNNNSVDLLRTKLSLFFNKYIETIIQPIMSQFRSSPSACLFEVLDGIHFLPVDANIFLKAQSFINHVRDSFGMETIQGALIYYDKYLLFSGVEHQQARLISKYIPYYLEERFKSFPQNKWLEAKFLTGPEDIQNKETKFSAPKLYLQNKEFNLIIYRQGKIVVYFLVDPSYLVNIQFYHQLDEFVKSRIETISSIFSQSLQQLNNFNQTFKYYYFNQSNLAIKTSLLKQQNTSGIPANIFSALNASTNSSVTTPTTDATTNALLRNIFDTILYMHNQFLKRSRTDGLKELILQLRRDCWVVGKYFGEREFYVILDQPKALSFAEVVEAVAKISTILFQTK